LGTVGCAFHQGLDRIVSTCTVLHALTIGVPEFIGLAVEIGSAAVVDGWSDAGSHDVVAVVAPVRAATCCVVAVGTPVLTGVRDCT